MRFLAILLLVSSCTSNSGLTVSGEGPLDYEMITYVIDTIERYHELVYGNEFDINKALESHPIDVYYYLPDNYPYKNSRGHSVDYGDRTVISLVYHHPGPDITELGICIEHYYVLAHEILHWVCNANTIPCTSEDNTKHIVPNLFLFWAFSEEIYLDQTMEWWIWYDILYSCQDNQEGFDFLEEREKEYKTI